MKRFLFILVVTLFVAVGSSSCKSHETCPAYGDAGEVTSLEANS